MMRPRRTLALCALATVVSGFQSGPTLGQESNPKGGPPRVVQPKSPPKLKPPAAKVKQPRTAARKAVKEKSAVSIRLQHARHIKQALDGEVILEFTDAPLSEIMDYLTTLREIPIDIDRQALDSVGLGPSTPVSCNYTGITVRSALALILDQLQLDYVIQHEVLLITTEDVARSHLDPRVYLTEDLDPDRVAKLVTSVIAPDTWQDVGGTGHISALDGGLVIAQTDQIHAQIADFIQKLSPMADQLSLSPRQDAEKKSATRHDHR